MTTAPVTVTIDTARPTITSLIIPARATPGFAVTWSAQDDLAGILHYDVQYKNESGAWTGWLVSTPVIQTVFTDPGEHAYTFRATDGAGNASGWQASRQMTVVNYRSYDATGFHLSGCHL